MASDHEIGSPFYWSPDGPDICECGTMYRDECCCELSRPDPDVVAEMIDEIHHRSPR